MNTEYILDQLKSVLESNLSSELTTLQVEAGSSIITPTPFAFLLGEYEPDVLEGLPSVCIWCPNSRESNDYQGAQDREVWFHVVTWIASDNLTNLHRFLCRYSDGISRILRDESNTPTHTHNCVVGDVSISELYPTNVSYTQGCRVEGTINYIMG